MVIIAALLMALLIAGAPAPAGATGIKLRAGSTAPDAEIHRGVYSDPRAGYPDPRTQYPDPRTFYRDPRANGGRRDHDGGHGRHGGIKHAPVIVVPQPVIVVAPRQCHEPGYWAYSWVPQNYAANVWVPGYYNSDALWVEGHYESRAYASGYYQPYWVSERWSHC